MPIFKSIRERMKKGWPVITIDLGRRSHRFKLALAFIGLLVVGLGLLVGGIQGYSYTESSEFCGTVCHSMDPQWVRYQASPHAKVECAQCHVGPGAASFVQSKMDGTRQLVETVMDNFSRPIKSPVKNLRPARETCEGCHSPTTFKDNIVKTIRHYDNDIANTPVQTTLILKMGGKQTSTGAIGDGIHWHVSSEVYYIALDDQRQVIAWVGVRQPDGSLKEYFARDLVGMGQTEFVEKARADGTIRKLDCIDCHNRTAHYIPYPEQAVDKAITDGLISRDLPFIREKAVAILKATYKTEAEAFTAIDALNDYYAIQTIQSVTKSEKEKLVVDAVSALKSAYSSSNFPYMNLTWDTNPNNERHTPSLGCFRCHDDKHVVIDGSADGGGKTISAECNLCHTVPIVGKGTDLVIEAPVIVGATPPSHASFSWTVSHRTVTEAEKENCYNCHGKSFCNNAVCHNLSHPADMLFTHAAEYNTKGEQVCYTCHQNIFCTRCHPAGVLKNP
jgi:nitrate/TMAO reductase-like tetraheme cytochrome c subunit